MRVATFEDVSSGDQGDGSRILPAMLSALWIQVEVARRFVQHEDSLLQHQPAEIS
jgi:hypothetical protein